MILKFYRVLPSILMFNPFLPESSFMQFYRVLLSFPKKISKFFSRFNHFHRGFSNMIQFNGILPSFTEYFQVLCSFTELY